MEYLGFRAGGNIAEVLVCFGNTVAVNLDLHKHC